MWILNMKNWKYYRISMRKWRQNLLQVPQNYTKELFKDERSGVDIVWATLITAEEGKSTSQSKERKLKVPTQKRLQSTTLWSKYSMLISTKRERKHRHPISRIWSIFQKKIQRLLKTSWTFERRKISNFLAYGRKTVTIVTNCWL